MSRKEGAFSGKVYLINQLPDYHDEASWLRRYSSKFILIGGGNAAASRLAAAQGFPVKFNLPHEGNVT